MGTDCHAGVPPARNDRVVDGTLCGRTYPLPFLYLSFRAKRSGVEESVPFCLSAAGHASGGPLFTGKKGRKPAGDCDPRTPLGPRRYMPRGPDLKPVTTAPGYSGNQHCRPFTIPPVSPNSFVERWCIMPHVPGTDSPEARYSRYRLTARGGSRPGMPRHPWQLVQIPMARKTSVHHRNSAKHGYSAPQQFAERTGPNVKLRPGFLRNPGLFKSFTRFFSKNRGVRGRAPGYPPHRSLSMRRRRSRASTLKILVTAAMPMATPTATFHAS